jgi:hypothetical protein
MTCDRARDLMVAAAAGEIESAERVELDVHLRSCPVCAGEQDRLAALFDRLHRAGVEDPGPVYWASYNQRIRRRIEDSRAASWRAGRRLLPAAAAAILVLAAVLVAVRREKPAGPGGLREPGGGPVAGATAPRAGDDLEGVLSRAAAARGAATVQQILEDMLTDDPWYLDDDLSLLSGEEREALAEELTGA